MPFDLKCSAEPWGKLESEGSERKLNKQNYWLIASEGTVAFPQPLVFFAGRCHRRI